MIKWLKRQTTSTDPVIETPPVADPSQEKKSGIYGRFKQGLVKTRQQLGENLGRLLLGKKILDAEIFEALETILLQADIGFKTTHALLTQIQAQMARHELNDGDAVYRALQERLMAILSPVNKGPLVIDKKPYVILMVGVNGAGKTTTIGKLAKQFQAQGKKVLLAAGDTFRAAAIEQLEVWGKRNQIPVIAQQAGSDSASVSYDALQAAKARNVDVLIVDTAGRLHTQNHLMNELKKVKRVLQKLDADTPHETILVLDATAGQNALKQAQEFHQALDLTSLVLTKLDGTAKGGIVFAIAEALNLPIRYLGVGESIDDLRPFDEGQFVKAIFND